MIVMGTAGHIDHGKSAIIKRLTGTDPDRLPEEKARGMTIDLGFAFQKTTKGDEIAYIDVPGHERFVRNMIAGAGGIDAVMLVIAADDGWMPQSQEHFQIIRLLDIKHGFIALNKIDLAEPDWLDLLEIEIREKIAGTFLEGCPIVRISAQTGEGFDQLSEIIAEQAAKIADKKDIGLARLYADRSFVQTGIGRIVTGTLRGGSMTVGQQAALWPSGNSGKIRTLQSKGQDIETAPPGSRVAVGMSGVDRSEMTRGSVITSKIDLNYFLDRPVLVLGVELLKESPIPLEDRRRALLMIGSSETEGTMRLYQPKIIEPGSQGIIFFQPDEPILALVGDRAVIRLVTPMVTLGGGTIIDHLKQLPRRKEYPQFEYLNRRLKASLPDLIITELEKLLFCDETNFLHQIEISRGKLRHAVEKLIKDKQLDRFGKLLYDLKTVNHQVEQVKNLILRYLTANPHQQGILLENLARQVEVDKTKLESLLKFMLSERILSLADDQYNIIGRGLAIKGSIKKAYDEIIAQLNANPYAPPTLSKLAASGKDHRLAIKFIIDTNEGYKVGSDFLFLIVTWDETTELIREFIATSGLIKPSDLRDRLGFSRKFAIPILEETDRIGLTERTDEGRIKGAKF